MHGAGNFGLLTFMALSLGNVGGTPHFTLFDDSMISMTYAQTLYQTGELIWFEGAERVQGFTNLAWTLVFFCLHTIGLAGSSAALAVQLLGVLTTFGIAIQVQNALRSLIPGPSNYPTLISGGIYFLYPLVFWSLRGMEVGLLAFLLILLTRNVISLNKRFLFASKAKREIGSKFGTLYTFVIVFVGVATRLDFIVAVVGIVVGIALSSLRGSANLRLPLLLLLYGAVSLALVLSIQYTIFGDWLPNTYYLKVEGFTLEDRLIRGVLSSLKLAPLILLFLVSYLQLRRAKAQDRLEPHGDWLCVIPSVLAFVFAYNLYVGGDAWENFLFMNRYLVVALPLLLIYVSYGGLQSASKSQLATSSRSERLSPLMLLLLASTLLMGIYVNPLVINLRMALPALFSLAALLSLLLFLKGKTSSGRVSEITTLYFTPLALIILVSVIPMTGVAITGQVHSTAVDSQMINFGLELKEHTRPNAVIAVMWAGAPAYYSDRPMIDMLGKNDSKVARGLPVSVPPGFWNEEFYPGHNKYDFFYSIGKLRPDVVAQTMGLPYEKKLLEAWGYVGACTASGVPIQILKTSNLVRFNTLKPNCR